MAAYRVIALPIVLLVMGNVGCVEQTVFEDNATRLKPALLSKARLPVNTEVFSTFPGRPLLYTILRDKVKSVERVQAACGKFVIVQHPIARTPNEGSDEETVGIGAVVVLGSVAVAGTGVMTVWRGEQLELQQDEAAPWTVVFDEVGALLVAIYDSRRTELPLDVTLCAKACEDMTGNSYAIRRLVLDLDARGNVYVLSRQSGGSREFVEYSLVEVGRKGARSLGKSGTSGRAKRLLR